MRRTLTLDHRTFHEPALDTAYSRALLRRVGAAETPETFRMYVPGRVVAFGRQDTVGVGGRKVMGVGQRLSRVAAHVGGVVVVDQPYLVNEPLVPIYEALGYEWDPRATASLPDTAPVSVAQAAQAIIDALSDVFDLVGAKPDPITERMARSLRDDHVAKGR